MFKIDFFKFKISFQISTYNFILSWWLIKLKTEHWGSQTLTWPKRYFLTKFHMHHFFFFLVKHHKTGTLFGNLSFKFIFSPTFSVLSVCYIPFCYKHSFLYLKIVKNQFHVVLSVVHSGLQFIWILDKSHHTV